MTQARIEDIGRRHTGPVDIVGEIQAADGTMAPHRFTVVCVAPNPAEDDALRARAGSARARALLEAHDETSERFLKALDQIQLIFGENHDALARVVAGDDLGKEYASLRAKLAADPPWDDGYLEGLQERYTDELALKANSAIVGAPGFDPDDPEVAEALALHDEIEKYENQVNEAFKAIVDDHLDGYADHTIPDLWKQVTALNLKLEGEQAFHEEFNRSLIWKCTRVHQVLPGTQTAANPSGILDLSVPYFPSRAAVDELSEEVRLQFLTHFGTLIVSDSAGKGSPAPAGSSDSSAPPSDSETAPSSSPTAATV